MTIKLTQHTHTHSRSHFFESNETMNRRRKICSMSIKSRNETQCASSIAISTKSQGEREKQTVACLFTIDMNDVESRLQIIKASYSCSLHSARCCTHTHISQNNGSKRTLKKHLLNLLVKRLSTRRLFSMHRIKIKSDIKIV